MITNSNGDNMLPSRSPRETKKGRDDMHTNCPKLRSYYNNIAY
jgi:hypothetical protein